MGLMVADYGRGRWLEVVGGRGGHQWPTKWSESGPTHSSAETEQGCFGPSLDFLQWFWWLSMVVEALG